MGSSAGGAREAREGGSSFGGELTLIVAEAARIGVPAMTGVMTTQEPFQLIAGSEVPGEKGFGKSCTNKRPSSVFTYSLPCVTIISALIKPESTP